MEIKPSTPVSLEAELERPLTLDRAITIDEGTREQAEEGVASTVFRARVISLPGVKTDTGRWVAIKSSSAEKRFSPEPHDILKEIAVLSIVSHANIIGIIDSKHDTKYDLIELWTPWIDYKLEDLLESPGFTAKEFPSPMKHLVTDYGDGRPTRASIFSALAKSIAYQVILALEYLHQLEPPVAHRDVKPRNVLLTNSGCVKLIDFGIAFHECISRSPENLWPETSDKMYNDVATGPFRAPELIFGSKAYDACATDLWSLGSTLAQFFTPIKLQRKSYYIDDEDDDLGSDNEKSDQVESGYLLPKEAESITFRSAEWVRKPLFDAGRGAIGLAWSIFRIRGTPNPEIWPDFDRLPDASGVQFMIVPPVDLRPHLPNLREEVGSTGAAHFPPQSPTPSPLDLIHRLIVYPPEKRIKVIDALRHPWFQSEADGPLLLPPGHPGSKFGPGELAWQLTWHGEALGHWLRMAFGWSG